MYIYIYIYMNDTDILGDCIILWTPGCPQGSAVSSPMFKSHGDF